MTKEELFALTFEQQEIWAGHATDPADNQIFCYIIHLDEGRLEDMIDNPADYDVGNEIQQMDSTISDDRVKQINSGAELVILKDPVRNWSSLRCTKTKKTALKVYKSIWNPNNEFTSFSTGN